MDFITAIRHAAAFQSITVSPESFYTSAKMQRKGKPVLDIIFYSLDGETFTAIATITDAEGCVDEVHSAHGLEVGNKAIREFFKQCQAI
jgi:hypothetical protein